MQLIAGPMFAAVADPSSTAAARPLIELPPTLAQRFESMTGLPPIVGVWLVNIAGAILILIIGAIVAGLTRKVIKRVCAKRSIDVTVASFAGNLVHALIMTFVVVTALGAIRRGHKIVRSDHRGGGLGDWSWLCKATWPISPPAF